MMKKNLCKFTAISLLFLQILLITPPIKFPSIEVEAIDSDTVNVDMSPTLSAPMIDIDNSITVKYDNINSYSINLSHNYEFESVNESHHRQVCADCGYALALKEHEMECVKVDAQYHRHVCSGCGYSTGNSLHTLKESDLGSAYRTCTGCGYVIKAGGNLIFPVQPYVITPTIAIE